jgi:alkylation response protein AidB-like acyl-CoA dehydrogenase
MLKISLSKESEKLRRSFRSWLSRVELPSDGDGLSLESFVARGRSWQSTLHGGGWVGLSWPKEFGGRGLTLAEEAIIQEELARVSAPQVLGLFGLTMVGPVLIRYGTQAQKVRYLEKILSGEEIWCQGFSEPGAGSDLAAVKTKAVKDGAGYRISGQKIWTSFAHVAQWCFVLVRSDPQSSRHRGLTYFLVPMSAQGITTRPLKQISGDSEFNEVFFDDVYVPEENIVGAEGEGWKIAIATLMFERVVLTFARQLQSESLLRELIKNPTHKRLYKRELMDALSEACAVRALSYEHLLHYASGNPPGPEGSLDKLLWSESFQRLSHLALKTRGIHGVVSEERDGAIKNYLYSRGRTIAAGTSEIQRSIIAERLLGLPRRI